MKQPELGNKISELRRAKGLTQEELVEKCNISVRTIQRIETGEVNPRSYTIKTILSALGSDFDDLQAEGTASKATSLTLKMAWIFGIVYFILGFLEGAMDFSRMIEDSEIPGSVASNFFPVMDYGRYFYAAIKILVLVAYVFFMRGFVSIGTASFNSFLAIISQILIGVMAFIIGFDVISFFYAELDSLLIQIGIALTFGALYIIFGIALIKLRKDLGLIYVFAGAVEIVAGILFLFLTPIGLVIQMLAVLLEIIIIYQFTQVISNRPDIYNK